MPLVSMKSLLEDARAGRYALCYCESWNLESLQAVIAAARLPFAITHAPGLMLITDLRNTQLAVL